MSNSQISAFEDNPESRRELAAFLATMFPTENDAEHWLKRLAFWWDENPYAALHSCRGWVLREAEQIVGFIGTIPSAYSQAGQREPAMSATTWAVHPDHRREAGLMGLKFHRLGRELILVDSTPSPNVQTILTQLGWRSSTVIHRCLVPTGLLWKLWATVRGYQAPSLPAGRRIVTDPNEIVSIKRPWQKDTTVEKWITPEYLRWYVKSPTREHTLMAVVDEEGCLSSYFFLTPKKVKGLPAWQVVDWFTTEESARELEILVATLCSQPSILPKTAKRWLVGLPFFEPEKPWEKLPRLWQREESVAIFYWLPQKCQAYPKRSVLAEGDWGL